MRHQVCRYIAMGVMGALLSGIPFLSQRNAEKNIGESHLCETQ